MVLIETVPNFSEGRDTRILVALRDAFEDAGCYVADVHIDADHNRSVYTVIGEPLTVQEGVLAAAVVAIERIDMTRHEGVHPCVGALDVLPFVPLSGYHPDGADTFSALGAMEAIAEELAHRHDLPMLQYGMGSDVSWAGGYRLGGAAGLQRQLTEQEITPLAGPLTLHPTAGAVIVGVRDVLVAFNVVLDGDDVELARTIASVIRERDGGLVGVRALGLRLPGTGIVQVSTNIERWREIGPADVVHAIDEIARSHQSSVTRSELVGLLPRQAWLGLTRDIPCTAATDPVLERHIERAAAGMEH